MYDVNSKHADDFINHEEILETLAYADENKDNMELIDAIIEKAKKRKGLTLGKHRFFLACSDEKKTRRSISLQSRSKKISTETVRSLLLSICQIIASTAVLTAVPCKKQTYYEEAALSGRDPKRSHRTSGHGT